MKTKKRSIKITKEDIKDLTVFQSKSPKIRVGSDNDGGYVIADGFKYDLLLSCGIETNIDFEIEFLKQNPKVTCYAFDGTIDRLPQDVDRLNFIKKNIGSENTETTTNLREYLTHKNIFLKMDIESHEYKWIQSLTDDELKKFKQIVIEIHRPYSYKHKKFLESSILKRLASTHWLIHLHGNNCCGTKKVGGVVLPEVFECTYIRKDSQKNSKLNTDSLPSELDAPNLTDKPDIDLNHPPFKNIRMAW